MAALLTYLSTKRGFFMSNDSTAMAYVVYDENERAATGGLSEAKNLADVLGCSLLTSTQAKTKDIAGALTLMFSDGLWRAHWFDAKTVVAIDFTEAKLLARIKPSNLASEHVVRAILGRKKTSQALKVLDATAGFGQDAFLLAAAGCQVTMVEQVPLLHYFLQQALGFKIGGFKIRGFKTSSFKPRDSESDAEKSAIEVIDRLELIHGNSISLMKNWSRPQPDIIYLDPMYAHAQSGETKGLKKTAAVKKNMAFLQAITQQQNGIDLSGNGMLAAALDLALTKVVVKRAPNAQCLENIKPASSITGKAARFDIYPR